MDTFMNLAMSAAGQFTGQEEQAPPSHQFNEDEVVETAQRHSGGSADSGMFSAALSHVTSHSSQHREPVDEGEVRDSHRQAYAEGGAGGLSAGSMGGAAAMQILQKVTSGGGGGSQTELISMAMAEAGKLFDQSGGASSGSKQDAINGAAMTVMKLVVQSKLGGGGGGMGGLMSLATKFI
ncbi:hypothetical protein SERLA73DRAFT_139044 [Serpula lacrymans var. lacrymans S7.3]|uniref:DUF7721 domain-containing protein n=2 Tax=Serpula lacrymans var. lacrymans TaxID=341189 RepID=F8Q070_SERL3|nr:uncharacterized protein SERLADRAFT_393038 [Serpula lacrymans var. lacrymans S7.9]EGN98542.1 hypothetical protein SERLA73DRAFT_139044 [Serpula lacrymans var. lacrymans S7.3]EGO24111.1 hypothetical protein SERLADRAFT_393038 [Serpula lacrymans var. lacrymans S7.9]